MAKGKVKRKPPPKASTKDMAESENKNHENVDTPLSLNVDSSVEAVQKDEVKTMFRNIPKGRPKSGRLWKARRENRYSEIRKDKPLKSTWAHKMQERQAKKAVKLHERQLQENRSRELEMKRKRTEDNQKRRLQNERKAELVQPIKNMAKIKRMRKKQLRKLEKR